MPSPDLIGRRFAQAQTTYGLHAHVQARVADRLIALLNETIGHIHGSAIDIGCGTGLLTRRVHANHTITQWALNDLYSPPEALVRDLAPTPTTSLIGDAQTLDLGGPYALMCAGSSVHWFASPQSFCTRVPDLLTNGGVFAMVTYGPGNLKEVAALTDHGLHYPALSEWVGWLTTAGMTITAVEQGEEIELFDTPLDALKSLKATGVTATGGTSIRTPSALRRLDEQWREHYSTPDGQVTLSWRPVWLIATNQNPQVGRMK
ncbi:hypothetical protein [Stomatohabitans albus]|uniref:hypothetical protein n=1 Tax=Stomatohabitans albus TaxID=3110766 RepID=UPI00300CC8B7